jgi:uncharacterized protein (DUF1919 family)
MPEYLRRFGEKLFHFYIHFRIKEMDFALISNNCWGADIYTALGIRYQSPFVGLFIRPDCYLKLLQDFRSLIKQPLQFKTRSHHPEVNQMRDKDKKMYPIGYIGDDIEIHFLHYKSDSEASAKWSRRIGRIPQDDSKLFVKFCDTDLPTEEQLIQFDKLPFCNKICFIGKPHPSLHYAVWIKEYEAAGSVENIHLLRHYRKYFDVADWLNGGSGKPRGLYRLLFSRNTKGVI